MSIVKPVKHHPVVKALLAKEAPQEQVTLDELAAYYGNRLAVRGFSRYLALSVPSESPTRAMRAAGRTHKVIVLGYIGTKLRLLSTPSSIADRDAMLAECNAPQV